MSIHDRLFRCTGFPRLQKLIAMVLGPMAIRYDRVLTYRFDDAWDAHVNLAVARVEAVSQRDAELAVEVVRAGRAELSALAFERVQLPEIRRYFEDI